MICNYIWHIIKFRNCPYKDNKKKISICHMKLHMTYGSLNYKLNSNKNLLSAGFSKVKDFILYSYKKGTFLTSQNKMSWVKECNSCNLCFWQFCMYLVEYLWIGLSWVQKELNMGLASLFATAENDWTNQVCEKSINHFPWARFWHINVPSTYLSEVLQCSFHYIGSIGLN